MALDYGSNRKEKPLPIEGGKKLTHLLASRYQNTDTDEGTWGKTKLFRERREGRAKRKGKKRVSCV